MFSSVKSACRAPGACCGALLAFCGEYQAYFGLPKVFLGAPKGGFGAQTKVLRGCKSAFSRDESAFLATQ